MRCAGRRWSCTAQVRSAGSPVSLVACACHCWLAQQLDRLQPHALARRRHNPCGALHPIHACGGGSVWAARWERLDVGWRRACGLWGGDMLAAGEVAACLWLCIGRPFAMMVHALQQLW